MVFDGPHSLVDENVELNQDPRTASNLISEIYNKLLS
jgi:hypothetical protein